MGNKKIEISFRKLQLMVKEPYVKNGFLDNFELTELMHYLIDCGLQKTKILGEIFDPIYILLDIAEIGLMGEEIGELIEAIRKDYPLIVEEKIKDVTSVGEECADIVIRVMNFCNRKDIDLQEEIEKKHKYNKTRKKLHGKKA